MLFLYKTLMFNPLVCPTAATGVQIDLSWEYKEKRWQCSRRGTKNTLFSSLNQVPGLGWSGPKSFSVHGSKLFVNKSKNSGLQFPESAFLTFRGVNLCWQSRQLSVSFLWLSGNCKLGFPGNISKPTTDISFSSFFFCFQRSALCRWKGFWSVSKWFIFSTLWYWRWTGTHKIVVFLYIISGTWSCFC